MRREPVVAVFDVGKTNKKLAAYSPTLDVIDERRATIETRPWRDLDAEDTGAILDWLRDGLAAFAGQFDVRAIAISGHGATLALLDDAGELALPVISYTSARGVDVQDEFYETYGAADVLHRATATADIGFANMAKVLHLTKTRHPNEWARAKRGLFWGPYFAHALSGQYSLEPTFPGNHTYLWDHAAGTWSGVACALGADTLFGGEMRPSWDAAGTVSESLAKASGLPADCPVTIGIHDSNANLLPYFARDSGDFVLLSTGTWNVTMRPGGARVLSEDEVSRRVFFNQDPYGRPVRTSLMTAGLDYDTYSEFTTASDAEDPAALTRVIENAELFVIPGVMPGASAFPNAAPRVVFQGETYSLDALQSGARRFDHLGQDYFAAINLGLAIATAESLSALGLAQGCNVFIEGGFAKNVSFCRALAALCPHLKIAVSAETEGTSLGTAITGWMLAEQASLETIGRRCNTRFETICVDSMPGLMGYAERFREFVEPKP